jgi:hypothetical protein
MVGTLGEQHDAHSTRTDDLSYAVLPDDGSDQIFACGIATAIACIEAQVPPFSGTRGRFQCGDNFPVKDIVTDAGTANEGQPLLLRQAAGKSNDFLRSGTEVIGSHARIMRAYGRTGDCRDACPE